MIKKLFIFTLMYLAFGCAYAQDSRYNYEAENKPLIQVLKDLEKTSKIRFAYAPDQLRSLKGSVKATNLSLEEILRSLLSPHKLSFEILEGKFVSVTKASSRFVRMKVIDQETGKGLPFAVAEIKGLHQGYVADANGDFQMIIDQPEDAQLVISFLGYDPIELPIADLDSAPDAGKGSVQEISMRVSNQELEEVVVKEYLNNGITTNDGGLKIRVSPNDMEILPGLAERDILLSAQILAGIGSNDETASGLVVRGSARDNTFVYWNNIPVYQTAHYFGNISSFIPSSIGEVDIYKNYIPINYTGSSAGLLLMRSKRNLTGEPVLETNINMTHADIYADVPMLKNKSNLMVAVRRSFNNLLATPTFTSLSDKLFEGSITQDVRFEFDDPDFEYNSRLVFSDLNLQWNYEPNNTDQFTFSAMRSASALEYESGDEDQLNNSTQDHTVSNLGLGLLWNRRWSDALKSDFSATHATYSMDYSLNNVREDGDVNNTNARVNEVINTEIRLTNQWAITKRQQLQFGYQFNRMDASLVVLEENRLEEDFEENTNGEGLQHSFFGEYTLKQPGGLELTAGARMIYYDNTEQLVLDPLVRVNYHVNDQLALKSSFGIYHQFLTAISDTEFSFSNTVERHWLLADNEIPAIENQQAVVGAIYHHKSWLLDLDVYHKQVDGLLARNLGPGLIDDDGGDEGLETIKGVDLTIRKKWKNARTWISYAFQDSEVDIESLELFGFNSALNIRHQLQISQTYEYGQFEFSAGVTVKSGLPFTEATGITFIDEPDADEDPEEFEAFYEINYGPTNEARINTYFRLDTSVWYKFPRQKDKKVQGEFGVSVLNVLNRDNFYNRTFFIGENEEDEVSLFRSQRRLLGITPNVSLRLRF